MNKALLDANALIAAFDESHADHARLKLATLERKLANMDDPDEPVLYLVP